MARNVRAYFFEVIILKATKKTIQYGEHQLSIETGEIARQASGAVLVSLGETVVMVTVVGKKEATRTRFLPIDSRLQRKNLRRRKNSRWIFKKRSST